MLSNSFDILIECNKSPFTKSSLTSTIREFKKFPEVSGPDNSHELSMTIAIRMVALSRSQSVHSFLGMWLGAHFSVCGLLGMN